MRSVLIAILRLLIVTWLFYPVKMFKLLDDYILKMLKNLKKITREQLVAFVWTIWPFAVACVIFLGVQFAASYPNLVEDYYSKGIYPIIASVYSWVSSLIPISLWDLFWAAFVLLILYGIYFVLFTSAKWSWLLLRIAQLSALLYAFFYLIWGFNYFRPDLETRLGWEKPKSDEQIFRAVLDSLIVQTNKSFCPIAPSDYTDVDKLIEDSYAKNKDVLGINYPNGTRRTKTMLFSSLFAMSGVSGYFGPFFNEVHLNNYLLPIEYPYVLAHEKAHQFGITNEAEANLASFIVCSTSSDQRLQYSGYLNLLVYFLSDASAFKDVKEYVKKIKKPVILDLRFQRAHWQGLQNKTLDRVQTAANNAYLKTNHIEAGVMNYNQVVGLVLNWVNQQSLHVIPKQK